MHEAFHSLLCFCLGICVGVKLRDLIDVATGQNRG